MSKNKKKYIFYIILMAVITGLTFYFVLKNNPLGVFKAIGECTPGWIIGAILVVLIVYLIEGFILFLFARIYNKKYKYHQGLLNDLIGVFFSDITPFNSGGQFYQAYIFTRQEVKGTHAASILYMNFIVYQITLVTYCAFVIGFKYNELAAATQTVQIFNWQFNMTTLSFVGFGISALIILGLFFMAYSKWFLKVITKYGIGLLAKMHIIKDKEKATNNINLKLESFRSEMMNLIKNWKFLIITSLLFFVKLVLFNSVPYFIAKGMGLTFNTSNEVMNFINATSMATLVSTITQMVPLPGASGGAELVFNYMFGGSLFINITPENISALILMWRGITFFLGLFIGLIVFIAYQGYLNKKNNASIKVNTPEEKNNNLKNDKMDKVEE